MSRLSEDKKAKIRADILAELYENIVGLNCAEIAKRIARDEEFIMKLLEELHASKVVQKVKTSPKTGSKLNKKILWVMDKEYYGKYKELLGQ